MELNNKKIFFDFEVFKYDTLLGTLIVDGDDVHYYQTWDLNEIADFYLQNVNSMWIGHNNEEYDNLILEAIVKGENPYQKSVELIEQGKRQKKTIPLIYMDLMKMIDEMYSLKMTEAAFGYDISETEVDFNIGI